MASTRKKARRKPAPKHGTHSRYFNKGYLCRCTKCRDAAAAYVRAYRYRTGVTLSPPSAYRARRKAGACGTLPRAKTCKCEPCRLVVRQYWRDGHRRRREAAGFIYRGRPTARVQD